MMRKHLQLFGIVFSVLMLPCVNLGAQEPTLIVFAGFDETPFSPLQITVLDDQGYSTSDDFVVDGMISFTEISIPADPGNQIAEGIQVQFGPTELGQRKFYSLSFSGSAVADREATLVIKMGDSPNTVYLDSTFTITAGVSTYSFEMEMTEPNDTSAMVSLGLGLSDVSVTLDDFEFTDVIKIVNECVEVEAESFADQPNFAPWFYVVDTVNKYTETACGGAYINSDSTSNPEPEFSNIDYEFTVEGGVYQVWFRGLGLGGSDDSFWVRMDDGSWAQFNNALRDTIWVWDKVHDSQSGGIPVSWELSPGTHTLSISYRESGAMLDKFLITTDTLGVPVGCDGCAGLGGDYSQTLFTADGSVDPLAPMELEVQEGYAVDDTYDYVRGGQLSISGIIQPGSPADDGIQVKYGPFASQANRRYIVSFYGQAEDSRQAKIYVGTQTDPDTVLLEVPFIMLNISNKYEFEFLVEDSPTESTYFSIQLGASNVPVSIDSVTILETFPEVDEECFAFEAEDYADQDLFPPLFVAEDPEACGGFYIDTEDGGNQSVPEDTGRVSIEFEVQQRATFVIWFRALAPTPTDDSYWVIMDDDEPFVFSIERDTSWLWDQVRGQNDPQLFDLLPGTHTLHIVRRETGTLLDKIFITNQLQIIPEGCDVCGSTSTEPIIKREQESQVRIYPNPASGIVHIEAEESFPGVLNVYNILGKQVMSEIVECNTSISIEALSDGIYFFEYYSESGRSIQKIVVNE